MTNQKNGASGLFSAARNRWKPARRSEEKGRQAPRERPAHDRPSKEERGLDREAARTLDRGLDRDRALEAEEEVEKPKLPKGPPGARPLNPCVAAFQALRLKALSFPGAYEDHAEGRTLVKLKNKNLVVALGREGGGLTMICKLPRTGVFSMQKMPFLTRAPHGLGSGGWMLARFERDAPVPLRDLLGFLEESREAAATPTLPKTPKTPAPQAAPQPGSPTAHAPREGKRSGPQPEPKTRQSKKRVPQRETAGGGASAPRKPKQAWGQPAHEPERKSREPRPGSEGRAAHPSKHALRGKPRGGGGRPPRGSTR